MPANLTAADRLDLATGVTLRTCRVCGREDVLNVDNFYRRNADSPFEARCQSCRRDRNREVAALRRAGRPVRARRAAVLSTSRKFGVEIEFIGADRRTVAAALTAAGIACEGEAYRRGVSRVWKIVMDGSVANGWELVSPPLSGAAGLAELEKACEALVGTGARVSRACGLHVHHDITDLDAPAIGRLFRGWRDNQGATDGLVAPSRRNSTWARPLMAREVERIEALTSTDRDAVRSQLSYVDRYRSLNIEPFTRYGTVEVRQHQGSTNFQKIAAWIAFGQAFIAAAAAGPVAVASSTDDLVASLERDGGLDAGQAETLRRRARHFSGRRSAVAA